MSIIKIHKDLEKFIEQPLNLFEESKPKGSIIEIEPVKLDVKKQFFTTLIHMDRYQLGMLLFGYAL